MTSGAGRSSRKSLQALVPSRGLGMLGWTYAHEGAGSVSGCILRRMPKVRQGDLWLVWVRGLPPFDTVRQRKA